MANPKTSTLTDIFLGGGFGFFGFGDGGFGDSSDFINPQWNTNSGNYGFDAVQELAFIEATDTPSYMGASLYDLEDSYFFAKIVPAPAGNGGIQTGLLIRFDRHNYVEISQGPNGQFNAYVSDDSNITIAQMPTYDPTAHAYWRIRDVAKVTLYFDTSPDGSTWTQQGSVPYTWDGSSVTVTIFSGFTGLENPDNFAYISHVNNPYDNLELSSTGTATASVSGQISLTDPNALSGSVNAAAGFRAAFNVTLGIPEGGLTDFVYTETVQTVDPLITNAWAPLNPLEFAGTLAINGWFNNSTPVAAPMPYRDGSYFQPAAYVNVRNTLSPIDTNPTLFTNAQVETTTGLGNRLPLNASIYTDSCAYSPGSGVASITRSTELALNGQYAGKIVSNTSPATLGDTTLGYFVLPQREALVPVRYYSGNPEAFFGSVYLSTARANTIWFASLMFYDSSYNILSGSTYQQAIINNQNTHPGSNIWQSGVVYADQTVVPTNAAWVAVVPVIEVTAPLVETVYTSNNSITTASMKFTEAATDYQHPRAAQINVKADRVNYVLNSGFNTGTTNWFQGNVGISGSPNSATFSWDSTVGYHSAGAAKVAITPPSGTYTGSANSKIGISTQANFNNGSRQPIIQGLKVGHTYTITAWILQGTHCPDVLMDFRDSNGLGLGAVSVNAQKITNPENIDGDWTRIQTQYTVPPTGLREYYMFFYVRFSGLSQAPFTFWVDSLMVEEALDYQGYFDGGFASADYKWESGGVANNSRSYYYKDYNNKFLRLNDAITSVLPVGEDHNLLFAQPIT